MCEMFEFIRVLVCIIITISHQGYTFRNKCTFYYLLRLFVKQSNVSY